YALEPTLATPARASRSPISALPISLSLRPLRLSFFFLKATAPPETYTLSLHDALPIWPRRGPRARVRRRGSRQGCPHRRAGVADDELGHDRSDRQVLHERRAHRAHLGELLEADDRRRHEEQVAVGEGVEDGVRSDPLGVVGPARVPVRRLPLGDGGDEEPGVVPARLDLRGDPVRAVAQQVAAEDETVREQDLA